MKLMKTILFSFVVSMSLSATAFVKVIESWGGQGIQLYVYNNNTTHMELDCAYANTTSWNVQSGKIKADGFYNIDPQSIATPDIPIVVEASQSGKNMQLQFSVEGTEKKFDLEKDKYGKVDWCD